MFLMVRGLQAADLIQPSAEFSPEDVIAIQLLGLQASDTNDIQDGRGIEQVWLFAHPDNKAMTGPLPRFRGLFDNPAYGPLVNHVAHAVEVIDIDTRQARFLVKIQTQDGQSLGYLWQLSRVQSGAEAGYWMTVSVSSPRILGGAL